MNTSSMIHHELFRLAPGITLATAPIISLLPRAARLLSWDTHALLLSVCPILTGAIGLSPCYAIFRDKSHSLTDKNRFGMLPYQFKAITGHAPPLCDLSEEHSLESCHDEDLKQPHHMMWRINQDPKTPDESDWEASLKLKRERNGLRMAAESSNPQNAAPRPGHGTAQTEGHVLHLDGSGRKNNEDEESQNEEQHQNIQFHFEISLGFIINARPVSMPPPRSPSEPGCVTLQRHTKCMEITDCFSLQNHRGHGNPDPGTQPLY